MIKEYEERLVKGYKFIDLNNKKWFMKKNGTVFALDMPNDNTMTILYSDTVMNAAIRMYQTSEPISLDQSEEVVLQTLASVIQAI